MDLKLQTLVDYQPMTQDQLISALEQYAGELAHRINMLETNRCLDELERSCIAMGNAMIVYDYVNKHGITHHACELLADGDMVAMEGVVDSAKEAVVKFVRWLCEMIKKICKSIVDLFKDSDESVAILSGNSSKIDDLLKTVDKDATVEEDINIPNYNWMKKSEELFNTDVAVDKFSELLAYVTNGHETVSAKGRKYYDIVKEIVDNKSTWKYAGDIFERLQKVNKLNTPNTNDSDAIATYISSIIKELFKDNPSILGLTASDKKQELLGFHKNIGSTLQLIVKYEKLVTANKNIINHIKEKNKK